MKLTDIDLSSLAEVAAAVTLLEQVHRELATGGTPLPELIVNPARETALSLLPPTQGSGETMMTPFARQQAAPISDDATRFGFPTLADAEKLRGMGVNPMTASESHAPMDAATVFGQSAAPLPQSAPASAGAAASPTAPAAPPASGTGVTDLPALAPLPAPSAAAPTAPAALSSPAGGVELDTDGLPWDERIHAGTKRKNDDGRWTKKRGLNDPALVTSVVAQLRAQMEAGGVTATAPAPHVKAEPVDALKTLATLPPAPAVMPTLPEQPVLPANPTSTLAALQAAMAPIAAQSAVPLPQSVPAPSTPPLAALPAMSGHVSLAAPTPPALPVAPTPAAPQQSSAPTPTTYLDFMTAATVEVQSGRVPIEAFRAVCKSFGGVEALNAKPELIPVAWASLKAKYPGML